MKRIKKIITKVFGTDESRTEYQEFMLNATYGSLGALIIFLIVVWYNTYIFK